MEILTPSAPAAPFPTHKHVQAAAKLSTSETKLLGTAKARVDELNQLAARCGAPSFAERLGVPHALDHEISAAYAALSENPNAEAAEKLHALKVRKRDCEFTANDINAAIRQATAREIQKLEPLAVRILDDAEAAFLAEAEAHREATKNQTTFASAAADFSARLEATKQAFEAKRKWIREEGASAQYLMLELGLNAS